MALSDVILASTLNNLAERYKQEGRYADAEPLYKRVLAINEKARGPDHRSIALALNDLAELYKEEGRLRPCRPTLAYHPADSARHHTPHRIASTREHLKDFWGSSNVWLARTGHFAL